MNELNLITGMGSANGMDEGQNKNLSAVMSANLVPTDNFKKAITDQKIGRAEMLDYKSGGSFGKTYLMSKYFSKEENKKNFSTPETTYEYLNKAMALDNPMFKASTENTRKALTFATDLSANIKTPEESNMKLQNVLGIPATGVMDKNTTNVVANYLSIFGEEDLKKKVAKGFVSPVAKEKNKIIDSLYEEFAVTEGNGDTTGAAPTGKRGLTDAAYASMKKKYGSNISEEKASKLYLGDVYSTFSEKLTGFTKLDSEVQKGILDAAYNLSYTEMLSYPMFTAAVKAGNKEEIFKNLLDTANVGGQSLKGLAKRRAASYNMANTTSKITAVEQKKDGTVNYYKGKAVFFAYAPKNGKHEKSTAGVLKI